MKNTVSVQQVITVGVALLLCAGQATAQQADEEDEGPKRSLLGISGTLARPVGQFQNFVDWGGGVSLYGVINLRREGPLGIRIDGSLMGYGHESVRVPFSPFTGRILMDVNTDNFIASVGVGPQVTFGQGVFQPYLYGTVGFSYFATVSSARGSANEDAFANTTNYDDATGAVSGGAGLMIKVSRGRRPVSLDFSARTLYNGTVTYLRSGSIFENPDGTISFIPIRSDANLVTFRVGVAIGV